MGLSGVVVADGCGFGFGIEGGKGVRIDDFWRKSVNCKSLLVTASVLDATPTSKPYLCCSRADPQTPPTPPSPNS